jgi:hypothetical protein
MDSARLFAVEHMPGATRCVGSDSARIPAVVNQGPCGIEGDEVDHFRNLPAK